MTSGLKTTEFWFAVGTALIGALVGANIWPEGSIWLKLLGVASLTLTAAFYALSRGIAKGGAAATTTSIGGSVLGDSAAKLAITQGKDEVPK